MRHSPQVKSDLCNLNEGLQVVSVSQMRGKLGVLLREIVALSLLQSPHLPWLTPLMKQCSLLPEPPEPEGTLGVG